MIREVKLKSYDIQYGNIGLEIREHDFRVEVAFGLVDIIVGCRVVYTKVIPIKGLGKWEIIKKVRPIIEDELRKNGVNVKIVY